MLVVNKHESRPVRDGQIDVNESLSAAPYAGITQIRFNGFALRL